MNKRLKKHFPTFMNYRQHKDERGVVFFTVLFVGLLLTFIGLSLADVALVQFRRTTENVYVSNALLTAEAGIEQTLYALNETESFDGFDEVDFYDNDQQGRGSYETSIEPGSGPNERVITSTGRAYSQAGNLEKERKVKVTIVGTSSPGYSVHTGVGGLILGGSAAITNSQIFVNGGITMTGAARIGTSSQPLSVHVAHMKCPAGSNPGPSYPQVCTSGQPISMTGSSRIYGSVCATNQTTWDFGAAEILPGSGGDGLINNCEADPTPVPTYDRDAHIDAVVTTANPTNINYNCSQWQNPNGFVRTMPANIRLNGNANWASSCDLTLTGDVYITGDLNIGGAARIRIADSVGTNRPRIMVDGSITIAGSSSLISNNQGTSAYFVSFESTAACSPDCDDVTGTDLYNSQNLTTINVAGAGNYPGVIFHAHWSKVVLGGSGNMGSAMGQTVDLSGAGSITFGTALSSGESTWTIRSYQYDYE